MNEPQVDEVEGPARPDVFGFKKKWTPSEPEPYDNRYPPDGQGVV